MAVCTVCNREHKDGRRKRCNSCNTKIRRIRMKIRAVEYLGGKCIKCNKKVHLAAFQFHHKNPEEKDFNVGMVANKAWNSVVKELDKCELVCANCHSEIHSSRYGDDKLISLALADKEERVPRKNIFALIAE